MRAAQSIFPWLLCFQAYVGAYAGVTILQTLSRNGIPAHGPMQILFALFPIVCLVAAGVNGIAAAQFRKGRTKWAWIASVLNLSLIPVGTVGGVIGLALLSRKQFREVAPPAESQNVPIDGVGAWSARLFGIAPVVVAAGITVLNLHWAKQAKLPEQPLWTWVVWSELAILVATSIHEAGHLICGRLSQFKAVSFVVGAFYFEKRRGSWRFRFLPKGLLRMGGHTGLVPLHTRELTSRALFVAAGGPIGSILVAVGATIAFLSTPYAPWRDAWPFFESLMVVGWMQAVANLIPFRTSTGYSDSARMRQMRRTGWGDQLLARGIVGLSIPTELRPRDWNTDLIERAALFDNGVHEQVPFLLFAYEMHSDRGNRIEAAPWMKLAIDLCRDPDMKWSKKFAPHFAFYEAYERGDAASARRWMALAFKDHSADWHRAQSALLHAEGDKSGAEAEWRAACEIARKAPKTGAYDRERDRLAEMGAAWFNQKGQMFSAAA